MSEEKKYGLWEYMSEQHGLTLLESEVHEIIRLARAEMQLIDRDEIIQYVHNEYEKADKQDPTDSGAYAKGLDVGIEWALNKVRNPDPQTIHFKEPEMQEYTCIICQKKFKANVPAEICPSCYI